MTDFNKMANDGYDPAFFRAAETMRAFGEGPFYAIEMIQAFLNTQGGARRNARAEVVGTDGEPIPHLYSAGEFGGMTPYQYNGGGNMAECLIFGQLAGVGAAAEKDPLPVLPMGVASEIVYTQGSGSHEVDPDPAASAKLGENEYLGTSTLCMGNELAVKVKMEGDKIAAIDIVQQQETAGVGGLRSRGPAGPDHRGPVHRGRRRCRRYRFLHGPEGRREQRTRPGEVARLMR